MIWPLAIPTLFFVLMTAIGVYRAKSKVAWVTDWAESISQWFNVCHGGNPNQTFSARVANERKTGHWYWRTWAFVLGNEHLDWASKPDEENE
ncbi:MAG: hypothetical protein R3C03_23900 [Pirellulaceae bacterium]